MRLWSRTISCYLEHVLKHYGRNNITATAKVTNQEPSRPRNEGKHWQSKRTVLLKYAVCLVVADLPGSHVFVAMGTPNRESCFSEYGPVVSRALESIGCFVSVFLFLFCRLCVCE